MLIASFAILLPSAGIYYYIAREDLPLSMASSDIVASLPLLLAVTIMRILALAALFIAPIALTPNGYSYLPGRGIRLLPLDESDRKGALRIWSFALIFPGIIHFTCIFIASFLDPLSDFVIPIGLALSLFTFTYLSRRAKPPARRGKVLSVNTYITLCIGLIQIMAVNTAMQIALRFVVDSSDLLIGITLLASAIALGIFQAALIKVIDELSGKFAIGTLSFSMAAALVVFAMLLPASGAHLTSLVVNPNSQSKNCMRLELRGDSEPAKELSSDQENVTKEVKAVYLTNSTLLVRRTDDETRSVYRIPTEQVTRYLPCLDRIEPK